MNDNIKEFHKHSNQVPPDIRDELINLSLVSDEIQDAKDNLQEVSDRLNTQVVNLSIAILREFKSNQVSL